MSDLIRQEGGGRVVGVVGNVAEMVIRRWRVKERKMKFFDC